MEELLITKVKERDYLFDIKSPKYKDRNVRQEAWEEIGRELNMKPELVKEKWLKLRRCFTNALNRRRWKQNDQAAKRIVSWKFGKQMSFLLPHLDTKRQTLKEEIDCKVEENSNQTAMEQEGQVYDFQDEKPQTSSEEQQKEQETVSQPHSNRKRRAKNNRKIQNIENIDLSRLIERDDNPNLDIMRLLAENSSLHQFMFQDKTPKFNNKLDFVDFDDSDMFFLSMSRMAKKLPLVSQAKIKLLLSQAVLEAEIANAGKHLENVMASLSATFVPSAEFQTPTTSEQ